MAYKNPSNPIPPNPVFVDKAIAEIQTLLSTELSWLTHAFGRSYDYNERRSGEWLKKPFVYVNDGQYQPVQFNDNLQAQCFFTVGDRTFLDYEKNQQNFVEIPVSIIFWANLKKIDDSKGASYYFLEELINDVQSVFNKATLIDSTFIIDEVVENKDDVLEEFDFDDNDLKFWTFPYGGFRIDMTLTVLEDCTETTPTPTPSWGAEEMVFTINTNLGSGDNTFSFNPDHVNSGTIDYEIHWGDGTFDVVASDVETFHTYSQAGIYQIRIKNHVGIVNYLFRDSYSNFSLVSVEQWGAIQYGSSSWDRTFSGGCKNLASIPSTTKPFGEYCFSGCNELDLQVENILVETRLLQQTNCLNLDVSTWTFDGSPSFAFNSAEYFTGKGLENTTGRPLTVRNTFSNNFNIKSLKVGHWDMTACSDFRNFLSGTRIPNEDYWEILRGWTGWNGTTATKSLSPNESISFGYAQYEIGGESEDIRNYLINTLGWTITDGGGI